MDLIEDPTSWYNYGSLSSSSDDETIIEEPGEDMREETYKQHGDYNPDTANVEDPRLANWNKWLTNRKELHNQFQYMLNREAKHLVMNSGDNIHKKIRNAKMIEFAKSYVTFDKYRGNPKFFALPKYIYDDKINKTGPVNCPVQEKIDRATVDKQKIPILEYIAEPEIIKYEKGLLDADGTQSNKKVYFHKCDYFTERKNKLQKVINLVDKFPPDLENLYVLGSQFTNTTSKEKEVTADYVLDTEIILEVLDCGGNEERTQPCVDDRFPILKIQGSIVDKNIMNSMEEDLIKVIRFLNCSPNSLYSGRLVVENVGTVSVRYSWEQVEPNRNRNLPLRYSAQLVHRFYFPIKSDIFLPGQITEIPFMFKSREPGVYRETWNLVVDPKLSKKNKIKCELEGFVKAEVNMEPSLNIEAYIQKCRITSSAINAIDEVLVNSRLETPIPYNNLFMNKDVFLHNNPDHFYEQEKVVQLMELYQKIPGCETWDFSIKTLRNSILAKVESVEEKRELLLKTFELSKALLKQNIDIDINNEKYRNVYQVLCSFANMIERDAENLRSVYRIYDFNLEQNSSESFQEQLSIIEEEGSESSKLSGKRSRNSSISKRRKSKQSFSSSRLSIGCTSNTESTSTVINSKTAQMDKRKSLYIKTLCIKTYQHLNTCVDEVTSIIESLNLFLKTN